MRITNTLISNSFKLVRTFDPRTSAVRRRARGASKYGKIRFLVVFERIISEMGYVRIHVQIKFYPDLENFHLERGKMLGNYGRPNLVEFSVVKRASCLTQFSQGSK